MLRGWTDAFQMRRFSLLSRAMFTVGNVPSLTCALPRLDTLTPAPLPRPHRRGPMTHVIAKFGYTTVHHWAGMARGGVSEVSDKI